MTNIDGFKNPGLSLREFSGRALPALWHSWEEVEARRVEERSRSILHGPAAREQEKVEEKLSVAMQALLTSGTYSVTGRPTSATSKRRTFHLTPSDIVIVVSFAASVLKVFSKSETWLCDVQIYGPEPSLLASKTKALIKGKKGRRRPRAEAVANSLRKQGLENDRKGLSNKHIAKLIFKDFMPAPTNDAMEKAVQRHYESKS